MAGEEARHPTPGKKAGLSTLRDEKGLSDVVTCVDSNGPSWAALRKASGNWVTTNRSLLNSGAQATISLAAEEVEGNDGRRTEWVL